VVALVSFVLLNLHEVFEGAGFILEQLFGRVHSDCVLKYLTNIRTMSAEQQQFFLKWNDFQSNMVSSFKHLRDEKSFTDVTLACEGQTCKAHKMVLSACSPYFKSLLEENPSKHPIIILKDVPYNHLQSILEFMYAGEVNVSQEQLPAFLKTADRLKVKGLAEAPQSIKREG